MCDTDISGTHIVATLEWECAVVRFLAVESLEWLGLALYRFPQQRIALLHRLRKTFEPYLPREVALVDRGSGSSHVFLAFISLGQDVRRTPESLYNW